MELLSLDATPETPEVRFDPSTGLLSLKGRCLPEDAAAFFGKLFSWVEAYVKSPATTTVFDVALDYYNTATSKQLYKFMCLLEDLSKSNDVSIKWSYHPEDTDMKQQGERLSKMLTLPFSIEEA